MTELSLVYMCTHVFGVLLWLKEREDLAPLSSMQSCLKPMGRCVFKLAPVYVKA